VRQPRQCPHPLRAVMGDCQTRKKKRSPAACREQWQRGAVPHQRHRDGAAVRVRLRAPPGNATDCVSRKKMKKEKVMKKEMTMEM